MDELGTWEQGGLGRVGLMPLCLEAWGAHTRGLGTAVLGPPSWPVMPGAARRNPTHVSGRLPSQSSPLVL